MARRQKLKVFRTPTGFHDAYVAAPSRKAALEAWGSDADLFARGIAEVVIDEELSREPLKNPGKVIRRSRGTAAEQLAALRPDAPHSRSPRADAEDDGEHGAEEPVIRRKRSTSRTGGVARSKSDGRTGPGPNGRPAVRSKHTTKSKPKARPRPKPRPSRGKLDEAESGLAAIVERQDGEQANLRERERALEKERRTMDAAHERERRSAERVVERERKAHSERLDRWIEKKG